MIRFFAVAAAASVLFACGGGAKLAPTKEAAAQALFGASQKSPSSSSASWLNEAVSGAQFSLTRTADCEKGGKVGITVDTNSIGASGEFSFDLKFDNCSRDGDTRMSGSLRTTISFVTNSTSTFDMNLAVKGRVNFSGKIDDFVEADVVQSVSLDAFNQTSGSVSISLNGTIKTSEGVHTYSSTETITFDAGTYTPAPDTGT